MASAPTATAATRVTATAAIANSRDGFRSGAAGWASGRSGGAIAVPAVRVSISIGAAAPVATTVSRPASGPPAAAAAAARPRSPADWKRCAGSLASARAITSSKPSGTPGAASETSGGCSVRCAHIFASSPSGVNGGRPASM